MRQQRILKLSEDELTRKEPPEFERAASSNIDNYNTTKFRCVIFHG